MNLIGRQWWERITRPASRIGRPESAATTEGLVSFLEAISANDASSKDRELIAELERALAVAHQENDRLSEAHRQRCVEIAEADAEIIQLKARLVFERRPAKTPTPQPAERFDHDRAFSPGEERDLRSQLRQKDALIADLHGLAQRLTRASIERDQGDGRGLTEDDLKRIVADVLGTIRDGVGR